MESNLLFGIPEIQVGSGKAHSECTAQQNLSNEGAEMQQVLLSVSFNHRKKRTYGFVTVVYHTRKLFLHPLICSIHRLTLGILGAGQPPKYMMAFAAQCCSAIGLLFLSL